jgi:hypothetical protein
MEDTELCRACGVPVQLGRGLEWRDNGVIGIPFTGRGRMVFYESDTIDRLFRGIEDLIGLPIEHIVIESRRRETRRYMEKVFRGEIDQTRRLEQEERAARSEEERRVKRRSTVKLRLDMNLQAKDLGRIYGYGNIELEASPGDEHPWRSQLVRNPYSVLFYAGDLQGSVEAFEQADMSVSYEELEPGLYRFRARPGEHPLGLAERLRKHRYDFKPGHIDLRRCPECDVPLEVGGFRWRLDQGIILDPLTGRRMAVFDPTSVDAILDDLVQELGEPILDLAVEAQRRYIRGLYAEEGWRKEVAFFRNWAALRGLGDITAFETSSRRIRIFVQNACMPLSLVGTAQAFCELALGLERSACSWELSEDGDLQMAFEA